MKNIDVLRAIQKLIVEINNVNSKIVNAKRIREDKETLTPEERLLLAIFGESYHLNYREMKRYLFNELRVADLQSRFKSVAEGVYDNEIGQLKTDDEVYKWLGEFAYPSIFTSKVVNREAEYNELKEVQKILQANVQFRMERVAKIVEQNAPFLIYTNELNRLQFELLEERQISYLMKFLEVSKNF